MFRRINGKPITVYVSGPYTQGDTDANVKRAIDFGEHLWQCGFLPLVPHLSYYWEQHHDHTYDEWLEIDLAFVEASSAVFRLDGYSPGGDKETEHAKQCGVPCFHTLPDLLEWANEHRDSELR